MRPTGSIAALTLGPVAADDLAVPAGFKETK
jgi:hypothetical protein